MFRSTRRTRTFFARFGIALGLAFGAASLLPVHAGEPAAPQFQAAVISDVADADPSDFEVADFNGDGHLDVALLTIQGGGKVHFALGDGLGNLRLDNTVLVPYGVGLASGDFNGDGIPDLAVTQDSNKLSRDNYCDPPAPGPLTPGTMIFLGTGPGTGGGAPQFAFKTCLKAPSSYLNDAVAGDFNGDGVTDLVVGDNGVRGARLYRGVGDGTFLSAINATGSAHINVSAPIAADVNNDGQLDVVALASGGVGTFLGNGSGGLTYSSTAVGSSLLYSHSGVLAFTPGDMDNDGSLDIVGVERGKLTSGSATQNFFFAARGAGDGSGYTSTDTHVMPDGTFTSVVSADFNKDGALDFAALNQTTNSLYLFLGRGNGVFADGPVLSVGVEPKLLTTRDLNGDNWRDFAVVDRNNGNASQIWTIQQTPGVGDATPPAVTVTAPAAGSSLQGTVTVSATATATSGVAKVEFFRNNFLIGTDTTVSPGDAFDVPWVTTKLTNGSYSLVARATDHFDNLGSSVPVSITIANPDPTPPVVTLTSPAPDSMLSGPVLLSADATDASGVTKVDFLYDTTLIGSVAPPLLPGPFTLNWDTTTAPAGHYTLLAKAYDPTGNVGMASVNVTVDQPPTANPGPDQVDPPVEATSPAGASVTLDGSGSADPDAGDTLSYEWRDGTTVLGNAATITVTLAPGTYGITLRVTDSFGLYNEGTCRSSSTTARRHR